MKHPIIALLMLSAVVAASYSEEAKPATEFMIGLQAAADRGEPDAQFKLAGAYLNGIGVPKDKHKAFDLMKSAATKDHADAMGALGYFYGVGIGTLKNENLAAEWLRKGAEKGSANAQLNHGKYLFEGKSGDTVLRTPEQQRDEAAEWIRKAADQGLPEACLTYGNIFFFGDHEQKKVYPKALRYLKTAADSGNADAQNTIGVIYEGVDGVGRDMDAAEHWFRAAALQGHAKAQCNLGRILGPDGMQKDQNKQAEGLAWLLLAQDQEEVIAKKQLLAILPGLPPDLIVKARTRKTELQKQVKKPEFRLPDAR